MKLTKNDKIRIINLYFEDGYSCTKISKVFNVNETTIKNIIKRYKKNGVDLITKRKHNIYSPAFKMNYIERYYKGESLNSLGAEINSGASVIYQWVKKYEQFGYNGLISQRGRPGVSNMSKQKNTKDNPLTDQERIELNDLRNKVRRLEMEIEATKKLNALVQERIKREQKKK